LGRASNINHFDLIEDRYRRAFANLFGMPVEHGLHDAPKAWQQGSPAQKDVGILAGQSGSGPKKTQPICARPSVLRQAPQALAILPEYVMWTFRSIGYACSRSAFRAERAMAQRKKRDASTSLSKQRANLAWQIR
jgi:hypothetical protein